MTAQLPPLSSFETIAVHQGFTEKEIIVIGKANYNQGHRFNIFTLTCDHKWIEWKNIPKINQLISSVSDPESGSLYIMDNTTLWRYNYENKKYQSMETNSQIWKLLIINGKLNGFWHNLCLNWSSDLNQLINITDNRLPWEAMYFYPESNYKNIIYVEPTNTLFMINQGALYSSIIYQNGTWSDWFKIYQKDTFNSCCMISTDNGRYVLIINATKRNTEIFIVDTKTFETRKSKMIFPKINDLSGFRVIIPTWHKLMDDQAVNGYIRQIWKYNKDFKKIRCPPRYLIQLIVMYYEHEILYVFQRNDPVWKCLIDEILNK